MNLEPKIAAESAESPGGLFSLALLSLLAGAAVGLVGAVFRLSLDHADRWRNVLIERMHADSFVGLFFVIAICAAATGVAAWLVRRYSPQASGSGIPQVEAVLSGALPQAQYRLIPVKALYRLIPVKFVGGVLAIGSGLALGREGPSVQMGASTAHLVGKLFRRHENDCKCFWLPARGLVLRRHLILLSPARFSCWRNCVRRFDTRITIVTLGASAGAIAVARVFLGRCAGLPCRHDTLPKLWDGTRSSCAGSCRRVFRGRLQPRNPRYSHGCGPAPSIAGRTACRADRSGGGTDSVVCPRHGGWWGCDHAENTLRRGDRCHVVGSFFASLRTRAVIVCSGNPRRIVRAYFGTRFPERTSLREYLLSMVPCGCGKSNHARNCRHGGIFYCGGSSPGYRHHLGHRDDSKLHFAFADAQRVLRGDADTESAG